MKEGYLFTVNGASKFAGPDLLPAYNKAIDKLKELAEEIGATEVQPAPSYVTVARNIREYGIMVFFIYFDGCHLNQCSFQKIELI